MTEKEFRKSISDKLSKYPKIYKISKKVYKEYFEKTGFLRTLPDFLIIGAARSGTTALYEYLIKHPDIIPPRYNKEISFFDVNFSRGVNWYKGFFPSKLDIMIKNNKKIITGEGTPLYLHYPHTPERVKKIIPNVKLIALLRNPIDRAYSYYQMEVAHGNENRTFEEAFKNEFTKIENEFEKMVDNENYYSSDFYKYGYFTHGIYVEQLERWFEFFPKNQILIIQSEKFFTNSEEEYAKILNFLDLQNFKLKKYNKINDREYVHMKIETRNMLIEYFRPHNEKLYKLIGQKFDWDK